MVQKSKLVILDTNVIIVAHQLGLWERIINHYCVMLPSTILRTETQYFKSKATGERISIDLASALSEGKVTEVECSAESILNLQRKVNSNFFEAIDPGELEALSLLLTEEYKDFKFCTGDQTAIKAMSVLDLGAHGISMERLLKDAGISTKNLEKSYCQDAFSKRLADGLIEKDFYLKK